MVTYTTMSHFINALNPIYCCNRNSMGNKICWKNFFKNYDWKP